jgi:hypothetical protein
MELGDFFETELTYDNQTTFLISRFYGDDRVDTIVLKNMFDIWTGEPDGRWPGTKAYNIELYLRNHPFSHREYENVNLTFTALKRDYYHSVYFLEKGYVSPLMNHVFEGIVKYGDIQRNEEFEYEFSRPIKLRAQTWYLRNYGETNDYWLVGAKYRRWH